MPHAHTGDDAPPAVRGGAAQLRHRRPSQDLAAAGPDRLRHREGQGAHAALEAHEHRARLLGGGRLRLDLADPLRQGGVAAGCLEELGDGRAHRDAVRVARVHAAQQGLDQAVDDLAAQALRHVLPDGHVVADLGAGQLGVALDAGEALVGQQAGQGGGGAGDAHHMPLGHRTQRAPGPAVSYTHL